MILRLNLAESAVCLSADVAMAEFWKDAFYFKDLEEKSAATKSNDRAFRKLEKKQRLPENEVKFLVLSFA